MVLLGHFQPGTGGPERATWTSGYFHSVLSSAQFGFLVVAGFGAGLAGSIAGLASLASYPALLLVGIPPVQANITNTVALTANTVGAVLSSRRELSGKARSLLPLMVLMIIGGALGSVLLLALPGQVFAFIVPWLVAAASAVLIARPYILKRQVGGRHLARTGLVFLVVVLLAAIYGGYFGAGAGVLVLAMLSMSSRESLPIVNAEKNVLLGVANLTAAIGFIIFDHVHWLAALAVAIGGVVGSYIGPKIMRRLPERPTRIVIAILGFALAVKLFTDGL